MHALRVAAVAALIVALATSGASAADPKPAQPVVVKVEEGGFHWVDAGLGAAAGVAASILVLALVSVVARGRHSWEEER
jgi:hypothetical protein